MISAKRSLFPLVLLFIFMILLSSCGKSDNSSTQPTTKQGTQQLPQTGNQKSSSLIGLGFASLLSALGLTKVNKKRKD